MDKTIAIILGMILAVIVGFWLGKRSAMEQVRTAIRETTKQLEEAAKKVRAKGNTNESVEVDNKKQ